MPRESFSTVDLFAGCGGLSLGLSQAGFETLAFSEISKDAAATFQANLGSDALLDLGNVSTLTDGQLGKLKQNWRTEGTEIDLVCGGPPCQGFSGIGHRRSYRVDKADVPSNHLFNDMIRVIRILRPKMFLFENVRGLISGRWKPGGTRGEIWDEVRWAFRGLRDYELGWQVIHAKEFGVPQNRPRIILVGAWRGLGLDIPKGDSDNLTDNPRDLIPRGRERAPNLIDVLSDLDDPRFASKPATPRYLKIARSDFQKEMRRPRKGRTFDLGDDLTEQEYTRHSAGVSARFQHMLDNEGHLPPGLRTKKFGQRLLREEWGPEGPTITVSSLPDDYVHYSRPRILTVREWARLQMFPDWFEFRGPRTTGGTRRAGVPTEGVWDREAPKYTQIGNAVPVGLARALGKHLADILRKAGV